MPSVTVPSRHRDRLGVPPRAGRARLTLVCTVGRRGESRLSSNHNYTAAMVIGVELTEDDLFALALEQERFGRRSSTARQIFGRTSVAVWLVFFAGLALVVAATLALLPGVGPAAQTVVIVAVAGLLWLVLIRLALGRLRADTQRAVIREALTRDGVPRLTLDLGDDGLQLRTRYGDLWFAWTDVRTVVEANERLFFFLPFDVAIVVPLAGMSQAERTTVLAQVEAHRARFPENDPADIGTR